MTKTVSTRPRFATPRLLPTLLLPTLLGVLAALAGCSSAAPAVPSAPAASSPTAAPSPVVAPVTPPPVHARFDYQIGGPYAPAAGVGIVDRDRTAKPADATYGICYVNAFQTQPEERAFWTGRHADLLVRRGGRLLTDPDWPGEYLLDTSTAARRSALAGIVGGWFDGCAQAGYRAVEPDNLDSWTRSKGRLTQAENVAYATLLARRAHAAGLAIAQKNTTELGTAGRRRVGFDFAIAEECQVYDECDAYTEAYGPRVIEIEYTDNPTRYFTAACRARGARISVILRDRDVVPRGRAAYRYRTC